jgi:hypothetical protein
VVSYFRDVASTTLAVIDNYRRVRGAGMIEMRVIGAERTELALKSFGLGVKERLRVAVTRSAIALTRYVKERKLSGQVLKNRTGTLRRKINYQLRETPTEVSASVGVQLSYAASTSTASTGSSR